MAGNLTVTQAAEHIPEIWSTKTRDATEAATIIAGLVDQGTTSELKGGPGDTQHISYISNPTANTKSAGTDVSFEQPGSGAAESKQTFTISTHQYVAFAEENITSVQSQTDMLGKYSGKSGYALAAAADTNLATLPQSFSQSVGNLGVDPTENNWMRAAQYLDDGLAPMDGRFVIVRPATFYSLQKTGRFTNADYAGAANAVRATERNQIGMVFNARVYQSTLVRAPSAGQAENWFCHPLGVYYCSQQMKTNAQFIIEKDADAFTATHIYGYAEALQPPVTAGGGAATDVYNCLVNGVS